MVVHRISLKDPQASSAPPAVLVLTFDQRGSPGVLGVPSGILITLERGGWHISWLARGEMIVRNNCGYAGIGDCVGVSSSFDTLAVEIHTSNAAMLRFISDLKYNNFGFPGPGFGGPAVIHWQGGGALIGSHG